MSIKSVVLAALLVLGAGSARAEGEGNNLGAAEVPGSNGVYLVVHFGPGQAQAASVTPAPAPVATAVVAPATLIMARR